VGASAHTLLLLKAMKWNIFGVRSARFWLLPGAVAFPQVSYASRASIQISKPFFYQPAGFGGGRPPFFSAAGARCRPLAGK
jgi:hypothetical protein